MGLYSPVSTPTYVPTLRLSLGQSAWARVVVASGGEQALLQSSAFLEPLAPADPEVPGAPLYRWWYEGDVYAACRAQGTPFRPGALYLAVVRDPPLVRVRLIAPGPCAYLALPDLEPGTLGPLVAAANALVP